MRAHAPHRLVELLVALSHGRLDQIVIGSIVGRLAPQHDHLGASVQVVQVAQQARIVHAANLARGEDDFALGELDAVHGLGRGVGVVQDDKDGANLGCGEEDGGVLLAVARHDADAVAHADAQVEERVRQPRRLLVQVIVRPARARPRDDEALVRAVLVRLQLQELPERQVDQRRVDWAVEQRELLRLGRHLWPNRLCRYWCHDLFLQKLSRGYICSLQDRLRSTGQRDGALVYDWDVTSINDQRMWRNDDGYSLLFFIGYWLQTTSPCAKDVEYPVYVFFRQGGLHGTVDAWRSPLPGGHIPT